MTEIHTTTAQVRDAALKIIREPGAPGNWTTYDLRRDIAYGLGIEGRYFRATGRDEIKAAERFEGQVRRVLDQLAGQGHLRKAGRKTPRPDDIPVLPSNPTTYWLPHAWDLAEKAAAQRRVKAQADAQRWARIYDQLKAAGFTPVSVPNVTQSQARGRPLKLGLDDMERMVDIVLNAKGYR